MTVARMTFIENRLGKLIRKPGGVKVAEALRQAEENLAELAPEFLAAMDEALAELEGLLRARASAPAEAEVARAYRRTNDLVAMAAHAGYPELGQAAFSLCELIDELQTAGAWRPPSVEVHLDSLRALRQLRSGDAEVAAAILEGLKAVVARSASG